MNGLDRELLRMTLETHAANAAGMLLTENGSAKADAYLAQVDYPALLASWKDAR